MRRRLLTVAIFLLAGAVVNVAVAWGCAVYMKPERVVAPRSDRPRQVETAEQAISLALRSFGSAPGEATTVSAELVPFKGGRVPFLDDRVAGRLLWKVTLSGIRLDLRAAAPGFEDSLERTFDIFIDPENGTPVEISSAWPAETPPIEPEPSSEYATKWMRQSGGEVYHAFPASPPSISFLAALNTVQREGMGSPIQARQIIADYVVQSEMGGDPRPVWSITLRGIRMTWPGGPPGVPPIVFSRFRNVVNAETGEWLGATNQPPTESKPSFRGNPAGIIPDPPTITFELSSPSDLTVVAPEQLVEWTITATVSPGDNEGLAMFAVDLIQDLGNAELFDILPGKTTKAPLPWH